MDFGLLKKLEIAKALNQQVKWDWKFGVSKSNPQNYVLEFTSQPIKSDIFVNLVKFVSKEQYKFPLDELDLNKEVVFPPEAYSGKEDKLMIVFPVVNPKNQVLVSKRLNKFSVTKTKKGLILKGTIGGLRKC